MSKINPYKRADKKYLEDQPKLNALIKSIVDMAAEEFNPDCYEGSETEAIECVSRDGFSAASYNCGGYQHNAFTDVRMIYGSGYYPTSDEARKQINKQYEANEEFAREALAEKLKDIPKDKQNYNDLYELGLGELAEELDNEISDMSSEDTIMYSVRIMYHGIDENGEHSASVSAAVNWESPYHRSGIAWMPGYKCEDFKEVEVTFKNLREAKSKLTKAIKSAMKGIV